jgi:L-asparaginase
MSELDEKQLPRVAVIGTGGTISSVGRHSRDLLDYAVNKRIYDVHELLAQVPETEQVAEIVPIAFKAIPSTAMGPTQWLELAAIIHATVANDTTLRGVVVTHGTASLEETAYFLNLVLKVSIPVVVVGAQRPASGISTDANANLLNAVRVAGSADSIGLGVLVVLNDEIHAAREVTKTSTLKLQTFRSPDFGCLGHADADRVAYYRHPIRRRAPNTEFDVSGLNNLPRVDIVMSYAGADGAAIRGCVAAGARGIVSAGFAPGLSTQDQRDAFNEFPNLVVIQSSRVGSGRVAAMTGLRAVKTGAISDNLTPQKARVLLMLGLTITVDSQELQRLFDEY